MSSVSPVASQKFPIVSLVVCFVAVLILCALGVWQMERLAWKNDLQQNLDDAFAKEKPDPFTADQFKNLQKGQVIRGTAVGKLDLSKAVFFHGRIQDGKSVMTIVAPFTVPSVGVVVPVEVGCSEHPETENLKSLRTKNITVTGILRQPRWSFVTPQNIPDKGEWWRLDAQELATYWRDQNLISGVITAENAGAMVSALSPCTIEKKLRNDHASYAFFWFTMAAVLSVIWGIRFLKPYLQSA